VDRSLERVHELLAGRYVVERELGRGGTATVYLARDERHGGRRVAVKVLHPELTAGIGADRFRSEIEIAAALAHPGILPVFDSGGNGGDLFYVMPFIEGESLRDCLTREGRLSLERAIRIASDVGEALDYAHRRDIVHRDIKPENILLVEGRALVADFGIARALARVGPVERLTVLGLAVGTPLYMSPEQASGDEHVDGRSDLYSLGCVLYEMLAGAAPHAATTPREMLARKLTPEAFPPPLDRLTAPAAVRDALTRSLAPDPADRFATTSDFVAAITPRFSGVLRRGSGWLTGRVSAFRARRALTYGALATLFVLTAAAFALWRYSRPPLRGDDGRLGLAVLPFRATLGAAAEWTEAIPDLLATALDGTPGVRVVDPWGLWRSLRSTPTAVPRSPDPEEAARLARAADACCFVLGSVALLSGQVDVTLRIYRRGTTDAWHTIHAAGAPDSIGQVVRQLALEIMSRVGAGSTPVTLARFDNSLTHSPDALKAWLSAREMRRRGQLDSAESAINRALELDSTFVLAMVDAVSIHSWVQFNRGQTYAGLLPLAEKAVQLGDSLPERARLRAAAMLASVRTDGPSAEQALQRILSMDARDVDAWSLLSYVTTVYGWQFGRTERDAIAAAEQLLQFDSTDATALTARITIAAGVDDARDLDHQLARVRLADTTSGLLRGMLLAVHAARASDADYPKLVERLGSAPVQDWLPAQRLLRVLRPDRAELLALAVFRAPSPQSRRVGLGNIIQLWSAESRWSAIDSLARTGAFGGVVGFDRLVDRLTAAAAIAGVADESTGRRAVDRLSAAMIPDSALAWLESRPVWHEGWLIGAYHAMYGDTALARRWAEALGKLPKGGSPDYGEGLRYDIDARLAGRRGDRQTALGLAGRALGLWSIHTNNQLELMPEPAMRFHLATLLRAAGKSDSATALFRSLVMPTTWMGFYTARASLELGELLESRDRATALRHYLTAVRLWEHGEPVVATYLDRAKRGLERGRS
jgi:tRNA A-37 threonylcarbamoyl transferase component Bud32